VTLHLAAIRENRSRDLIESMRRQTLIKKLTALKEFWPEEAREKLLNAAWRIDGEVMSGAIAKDRPRRSLRR
jgi:hypothetical protein